jgi:hypothetical protein
VAFTSSVWEISSNFGCGTYSACKHAVAAYAKTIAVEMGALNVKPILFQMGFLRTELMEKGRWTDPTQKEYKPALDVVKSIIGDGPPSSADFPGDAAKFGARIVETVHDTGRKSMFVQLGTDGLETVRAYAKALLAACEENEQKARSTDLDEQKRGLFAQTENLFFLT